MSELATSRTTDELQLAYVYWLSQLVHLSDRSVLKLKGEFPTFESWDQLSPSQRKEAAQKTLGNDSTKVFSLNFDHALEKALADLKSHQRMGIEVLPIDSPRYPYLLKQIPDPPLMLFVRGSSEALSANNNVAVVGTRDATPTGEKVAVLISKWLGENKWGIVSGLAKGIDTAAHKGALEVGARTVAVMATPLDKVYPAENRALAHQILDAGGCWVSELPLWSKFFPGAFVQRDRIQSGLSVAVIPVQTDVEGGTMHTVRYAEKQKRMLLCPRPIGPEQTLKQYAGVKHLIETHRATAFSAEQYPEILESLGKHLALLLKDWTPHPDVSPKHVFIDPYATAHAIQPAEEENPRLKRKTKPKKGKPPQIAFGFIQDTAERPRPKSSKEQQQTEAKIALLEQIRDEIEQARLHHGRDLSDAEIKELLDSKIRVLRNKS